MPIHSSGPTIILKAIELQDLLRKGNRSVTDSVFLSHLSIYIASDTSTQGHEHFAKSEAE